VGCDAISRPVPRLGDALFCVERARALSTGRTESRVSIINVAVAIIAATAIGGPFSSRAVCAFVWRAFWLLACVLWCCDDGRPPPIASPPRLRARLLAGKLQHLIHA
jgi:hypothetical protein